MLGFDLTDKSRLKDYKGWGLNRKKMIDDIFESIEQHNWRSKETMKVDTEIYVQILTHLKILDLSFKNNNICWMLGSTWRLKDLKSNEGLGLEKV